MIWVVAACLAGFLLVCAAVGYLGKLNIPQKTFLKFSGQVLIQFKRPFQL